ncbi:MAG: DUF559 domain-containing protein [Candidatus Margulisiibacteriota bacterium]|nr:DUF559 domain-containing protein [Candidatus Margulisiibacteriota bacterium]
MREKKKIFVRTLRKYQTKTEEILWGLLRNRKFMGLKFRRQHVIEGFKENKKFVLKKLRQFIDKHIVPLPMGEGRSPGVNN